MRVRALRVGLIVTCCVAVWIQAPVATAADGCVAGVQSDFNGDGWSDAVVGDPYATVAGQIQAGRMVVLYGESDGMVGEGARDVLWQGAQAVTDSPETGDRFASSLAAADLDCDGYTDVAVGPPFEDLDRRGS